MSLSRTHMTSLQPRLSTDFGLQSLHNLTRTSSFTSWWHHPHITRCKPTRHQDLFLKPVPRRPSFALEVTLTERFYVSSALELAATWHSSALLLQAKQNSTSCSLRPITGSFEVYVCIVWYPSKYLENFRFAGPVAEPPLHAFPPVTTKHGHGQNTPH